LDWFEFRVPIFLPSLKLAPLVFPMRRIALFLSPISSSWRKFPMPLLPFFSSEQPCSAFGHVHPLPLRLAPFDIVWPCPSVDKQAGLIFTDNSYRSPCFASGNRSYFLVTWSASSLLPAFVPSRTSFGFCGRLFSV